jgi:hypothetical protein
VHVHPPAPDQRRVQLVDQVGGEHDDPLAAVRRPEPVDEVLRRPDRVTVSRGGGGSGFSSASRRRGLLLLARSPVTSRVQSMSSMTTMDLLVSTGDHPAGQAL